MRQVKYTDAQGYQRTAYVRDTDPDELAPLGVRADPPDVAQIDWADVRRRLHNLLAERGLLTWADVEHSQNALVGVAQAALAQPLKQLFRAQAQSAGRDS